MDFFTQSNYNELKKNAKFPEFAKNTIHFVAEYLYIYTVSRTFYILALIEIVTHKL